jgi:hypothetical protein
VIEPYVEAIFWQELPKLPVSRSRRELIELEREVSEHERSVARYRDNVQLQRRLGEERFSDGLAARMERPERSLLAVHAARARGSAPDAPAPRVLRATWRELSLEERRGLSGR